MKEHNISAKHKTCRKICVEALRRLQDHLSIDDENGTIKNDPSTYFCDACCAIIKNKNKILHETSSVHKKIVLRDCRMNELLNLYINKGNFESTDLQDEKQINLNNMDLNTYCAKDTEVREKNVTESQESLNNDDEKIVDKYDAKPSSSHTLPASNLLTGYTNDTYSKISNENHVSKQEINLNEGATVLIDSAQSIPENNVNKNLIVERKDLITNKTHLRNESDELDKENDINSTNTEIKTPNQSVGDQNDLKLDKKFKQKLNIIRDDDENLFFDDHDDWLEVDYIMMVVSQEYYVDENQKAPPEPEFAPEDKTSVLSATDLQAYLYFITKLNEVDSGNICMRLTMIDEDNICIQSCDNSKIVVRANNFNGFCFKDGVLQCEVCMMVVDGHPTDHVYDTDHIANVIRPLQDKHCLRQINNYNSIMHCVLCNETFLDVNLHKLIDSHSKALEEAISYKFDPKPISRRKRDGKSYCEPCNNYIDTQVFESHVNSKRHKKNIIRLMKNQIEQLNRENIATNKSVLKIPESSRSVGNHHVKTVCRICKINLHENSVASHINCNQHLANLLSLRNWNLLIPVCNEYFFCNACKINLNPTQLLEHIETKTHEKALAQLTAGKSFCDSCRIYVLAKWKDSHLSGRRHMMLANESRADENILMPIPSKSAPQTALFYQDHTTKVIAAKCRICNRGSHFKIIADSEQEISKHINGKDHIQNFYILLFDNKIKTTKNGFFCEACELNVMRCDEVDHIESKDHIEALSKYGRRLKSIQEHEDNFYRKAKNLINTNTRKIQHSHSDGFHENRITVRCNICDQNVTVEEFHKHFELASHFMKYALVLTNHKIVPLTNKNNKYYCRICLENVRGENILKHTRSLAHLFEKLLYDFNIKSAGGGCAVCQ